MIRLAIELIAVERKRQASEEGYDAEHDKGHADQLALAAQSYCLSAADSLDGLTYKANNPADPPMDWPWHPSYWKPTGDPVRDLVKAGALIAAAIDSLTEPDTADAEHAPILTAGQIVSKCETLLKEAQLVLSVRVSMTRQLQKTITESNQMPGDLEAYYAVLTELGNLHDEKITEAKTLMEKL